VQNSSKKKTAAKKPHRGIVAGTSAKKAAPKKAAASKAPVKKPVQSQNAPPKAAPKKTGIVDKKAVKPKAAAPGTAKKAEPKKPAAAKKTAHRKAAHGKTASGTAAAGTSSRPGDAAAAKQKFQEALQAGRKRDYKKASLILEDLLSGFEAPPEAYLFLGRARHALKDYSRALASFNDYIRLRPDSFQGYLFAGRSYLALGLPYKSLPLLRRSLELNPDDITVMSLLGFAWLKARHSAQAVDMLQQAVETAAARGLQTPAYKRVYRAYINALLVRGLRLCRNEDYELGAQMLRFVLENSEKGESVLLRLELGRACRELGLLEEALEHYTEAISIAPGDLRIRWYRASILMALEKTPEALKEIEQIRSRDSGLPDLPWNSDLVNLYMIRSFLETGEYRRSADACRDWIKHHEGDPAQDAMIHAMYAEALRNLKDYEPALNHLNRALEGDGDNVQLWYEVMLIAWEAENWKTLRRALKTAESLDGDKDLLKRFAILLEAKTGNDDRKIIILLQEAILSLGPEPELMYALGERYLKTGLIELSLSWFRKTIEIQSNHERAWLGIIAALEALSLELGSEDEGSGLLAAAESRKNAERQSRAGQRKADIKIAGKLAGELSAAYDSYVKLWPDNTTIRRERALYLIHTFAYEEAVPELEALLAWEPSNPSLRRLLAYVYRKTGRYREASVFLKGLLKEKPRNVELLLEYSGCLERAGASPYAKAVLEKAMVMLSREAEIPMALGLLYSREQKLEKAYDLLREAASRNKADPRPYQLMAVLARKNGNKEGAAKYDYEANKRAKR
jgi:tetratricopeptide (TPR) repeat protein